MRPETKKRILLLIEKYSGARVQEELAGVRDSMSIVRKYDAIAKQAWADLDKELDALTETAP